MAAAQRHGRFISPPEGIRTKEDLNRVVKVHLKLEDETEIKEYYLIVYRTLSATVCFTVDGEFSFTSFFFSYTSYIMFLTCFNSPVN